MTSRPKIALMDVVWRTCGASPGCSGIAREPYGRCLAHLTPAETGAVLRGLAPGQALDLRGTTVTEDLLTLVLGRLERRVGRARFDHAVFTGQARFGEVVFTGDATFDHARFDRLASFYGARFLRNVSFRAARFARELSLHEARVRGHAAFDHATIRGDALFGAARFGGDPPSEINPGSASSRGAPFPGSPSPGVPGTTAFRAAPDVSSHGPRNTPFAQAPNTSSHGGRDVSFEGTQFRGFAAFDAAVFAGDVAFRGARFHRAVSFRGAVCGATAAFEGARFQAAAYLGPMRVGRRLSLAGVRAGAALHVETGGCRVILRTADVAGPLVARLSDADLDLRDAVLGGTSAVTRRAGRLRVTSLDGLDAGALTLTGADLRGCGLGGLRRPERLRLRECLFAATPAGMRLRLGWPPVRWWSRRRVLADEHLWRGWDPAGPPGSPDAARLALLYERLRPGVDDARTAADFAFGAMDMRRLGSSRGRARLLLSIHWLASGYGLRTGRALGWLTLVTALAAGAVCWTAGARPVRQPIGQRPHVAVVRAVMRGGARAGLRPAVTASGAAHSHSLPTRAG
ncbi:pentapeptide repeat-containing protein [Microbispora amethystogenes]|uniref:pentapeptide repeat-containing protein n=1 Tax=Microbispora amethystogenes TaxID=1427754 RepID=UPI0033F97D57